MNVELVILGLVVGAWAVAFATNAGGAVYGERETDESSEDETP